MSYSYYIQALEQHQNQLDDKPTLNDLKKSSNLLNFTHRHFMMPTETITPGEVETLSRICSDFLKSIVGYFNNETYPIDPIFKSYLTDIQVIFGIKNIVPTLLKILGDQILNLIHDPSIDFWTGYELVKFLNSTLCTLPLDQYRNIFLDNMMNLWKLMDLLCICGDYDYQASILELIFRLVPKVTEQKTAFCFFPESDKMQCSLMKIRKQQFDIDSRAFLNMVNAEHKHVFSIKADDVHLGKRKTLAPEFYNNSIPENKIWVDFNMKSESITIQCSPQSLSINPVDVDKYEMIFIHKSVVKKIYTKSLSHNLKEMLVIDLLDNINVFLESSKELAAKCKVIKMLFTKGNLYEELINNCLPRIFSETILAGSNLPLGDHLGKTLKGDTSFKPLNISIISKPVASNYTTISSKSVVFEQSSEQEGKLEDASNKLLGKKIQLGKVIIDEDKTVNSEHRKDLLLMRKSDLLFQESVHIMDSIKNPPTNRKSPIRVLSNIEIINNINKLKKNCSDFQNFGIQDAKNVGRELCKVHIPINRRYTKKNMTSSTLGSITEDEEYCNEENVNSSNILVNTPKKPTLLVSKIFDCSSSENADLCTDTENKCLVSRVKKRDPKIKSSKRPQDLKPKRKCTRKTKLTYVAKIDATKSTVPETIKATESKLVAQNLPNIYVAVNDSLQEHTETSMNMKPKRKYTRKTKLTNVAKIDGTKLTVPETIKATESKLVAQNLPNIYVAVNDSLQEHTETSMNMKPKRKYTRKTKLTNVAKIDGTKLTVPETIKATESKLIAQNICVAENDSLCLQELTETSMNVYFDSASIRDSSSQIIEADSSIKRNIQTPVATKVTGATKVQINSDTNLISETNNSKTSCVKEVVTENYKIGLNQVVEYDALSPVLPYTTQNKILNTATFVNKENKLLMDENRKEIVEDNELTPIQPYTTQSKILSSVNQENTYNLEAHQENEPSLDENTNNFEANEEFEPLLDGNRNNSEVNKSIELPLDENTKNSQADQENELLLDENTNNLEANEEFEPSLDRNTNNLDANKEIEPSPVENTNNLEVDQEIELSLDENINNFEANEGNEPSLDENTNNLEATEEFELSLDGNTNNSEVNKHIELSLDENSKNSEADQENESSLAENTNNLEANQEIEPSLDGNRNHLEANKQIKPSTNNSEADQENEPSLDENINNLEADQENESSLDGNSNNLEADQENESSLHENTNNLEPNQEIEPSLEENTNNLEENHQNQLLLDQNMRTIIRENATNKSQPENKSEENTNQLDAAKNINQTRDVTNTIHCDNLENVSTNNNLENLADENSKKSNDLKLTETRNGEPATEISSKQLRQPAVGYNIINNRKKINTELQGYCNNNDDVDTNEAVSVINDSISDISTVYSKKYIEIIRSRKKAALKCLPLKEPEFDFLQLNKVNDVKKKPKMQRKLYNPNDNDFIKIDCPENQSNRRNNNSVIEPDKNHSLPLRDLTVRIKRLDVINKSTTELSKSAMKLSKSSTVLSKNSTELSKSNGKELQVTAIVHRQDEQDHQDEQNHQDEEDHQDEQNHQDEEDHQDEQYHQDEQHNDDQVRKEELHPSSKRTEGRKEGQEEQLLTQSNPFAPAVANANESIENDFEMATTFLKRKVEQIDGFDQILSSQQKKYRKSGFGLNVTKSEDFFKMLFKNTSAKQFHTYRRRSSSKRNTHFKKLRTNKASPAFDRNGTPKVKIIQDIQLQPGNIQRERYSRKAELVHTVLDLCEDVGQKMDEIKRLLRNMDNFQS